MERYDIAIIGTGPAGLEAAVTAKIRNKKLILFGNKNLSIKVEKAHTIQNYLGLPNIAGEDLKAAYENHLKAMDIQITEDKINAVYAMGEYFALQGNGIDRADTARCNGKGWTEDKCYTLNTIDRPAVCAGFSASIGAKAYGIGYMPEQSPTLSSQRHDASVLCLNDQGGSVMGVTENVSGTLRAQEHGHQPHILDMAHACDVVRVCGGITPSLQARMGTGGNQVPLVAYGIGNGQVNEATSMAYGKAQTLNTMHDAQAVFCQDVAHSLKAKANCNFREDSETYPVTNGSVRRLTPLECERLQGFPDGWTNIGDWVDSKGKKRQTSDSARYKALGNSIALPPWKWVLKRLCAQYERDATMASLFDGIGGFPLIWEQLNGKGSCLWASEIEEFPMAVTKRRYP